MGLLAAVVKKVRKDGALGLAEAGWFTVWRKVERVVPPRHRRAVVQLLYLPYGYLVLPQNDHWSRVNPLSGRAYHFPLLADHKRTRDIAPRHSKYVDEGFVELEEGDVVVEVGAYCGTFTRLAAKYASRVVAVEPNPLSADCLEWNTYDYRDTVTVRQAAVWNESKVMSFNLGLTPNDDSLIAPDDGGSGRQVEVQAERLDDVCASLSIDRVDFLKIEAEGVEPEVLEGMSETPVRKVAVECGAERDGDSPAPEVRAILERRGFEVSVLERGPKDSMVYGRRAT